MTKISACRNVSRERRRAETACKDTESWLQRTAGLARAGDTPVLPGVLLLREHEGRVRDGLVGEQTAAPFGCVEQSKGPAVQ
jgi:hypothetical protein